MATKTSNKKTETKASNKSSDKKTATKATAKTSAKAASTTPSATAAPKTSNKTSDKTEKDTTSNNQVIFAHEDGWGVRKEGSDTTTAVYDTRVEALERAREIAENQGGEVYILHTGEEPTW